MQKRDEKGRFVKGFPAWNSGITAKDDNRILSGIRHPEYGKPSPHKGTKKNYPYYKWLSTYMLGNKRSVGAVRSQEFKDMVSRNNSKRIGILNPRFGCTHRQSSIDKLKSKRKNWKIPFKDTKPEKIMQIALALEYIEYEKHKAIKIKDGWHRVDLFIYPNICIEVDGDYWHSLPKSIKRDLVVNEELEQKGMKVIRIWESEILKDPKICVERIKAVIS